MNKDIIQGNWKEIKGKLTQQWGNLTDDDITHMKGTRQELQGMLQKKYGYQQDRIEKEIDNFLKQNGYNK
jgi:uncharacterized protein YjbJ (UPF0337 family)